MTIKREDAQEIASRLHNGKDCLIHSFAATGIIRNVDALVDELSAKFLACETRRCENELIALMAFVELNPHGKPKLAIVA